MKRMSGFPVVAIVALCFVGMAAAGPLDYQYTNPTDDHLVYKNTTKDVADVQAAVRAVDYMTANDIYTNGKNARRSPTTFNRMKNVGAAGDRHAGEAYYEAFSTFYGVKFFLDEWLGGALNGTGEYSKNAAFRKGSALAYSQVYSWFYMLHEADVAYLGITGYDTPIRKVVVNPDAAVEEIDDSYSVFEGDGSPFSPKVWAFKAASSSCISRTAASWQMNSVVEGYKKAQAAAIAFKQAGVTPANQAKYAKQYKAGRDQMVRFFSRSWLQVCMQNIVKADQRKKADEKAEYQATAIAAFRAVAPFLKAEPGGPETVAKCHSALLSIKPSQVRNALEKHYRNQGTDFKRIIYGCI